jgi:hypothetical protein
MLACKAAAGEARSLWQLDPTLHRSQCNCYLRREQHNSMKARHPGCTCTAPRLRVAVGLYTTLVQSSAVNGDAQPSSSAAPSSSCIRNSRTTAWHAALHCSAASVDKNAGP